MILANNININIIININSKRKRGLAFVYSANHHPRSCGEGEER